MTFIKKLKSRGPSPRSGRRPGKAQVTPACAKSMRATRVFYSLREKARSPLQTSRGLHGPELGGVSRTHRVVGLQGCCQSRGARGAGDAGGSQGGCAQGAPTPRRRLQTNPGTSVTNNQPDTVTNTTRR